MINSNKILFITSEFPPQPGGIGNHAYNLSKELATHGYEVQVLCDTRSTDSIEENKFDAALPFDVVRIKRRMLLLTTYLNRNYVASNLLRRNNIVIASGKFSLWLAAFLSLFSSKRFIAIVHGSELQLHNPILRRITDACLKKFDCVIAVSRFTSSLLDHLKLNNVFIIPNGFNIHIPDHFKNRKPSGLGLITIGNVTERKGQHNVISALPELRKDFPDIHYNIVGIPTEIDSLIELSEKLEVENNITFHGRVSEDRKIELLTESTIFVMLSEKTLKGDVEGFGIAILEANSLGIPAIGALGCGIEDAIKDKYSGILIAPRDPGALVEAVCTIVKDYEKYSTNAKDWATHFDWGTIVKQYMILIDEES